MSTSNPQASGRPRQTAASASTYLESLTRSIVEAVNTRRLESHPSSLQLSPNLESSPDYMTPTFTVQQYFAEARRLISLYPQYQSYLTDVKANVNLRAGYADVYTKTTVTGLPPGVVGNSVCVLEFRFREGVWMCVKMTGIRGMGHGGGMGGDGEGSQRP